MSELVDAVRRDLEACDRLGSPLGLAAVRIAERMSDPKAPATAVASLSRELRTVLAEVLADAPRADAMDELAQRRRDRVSA